MKTTVRRIFSGILFLVILSFLLFVSSLILQPKDNFRKSVAKDPMAVGILGEPDETIDAVILGDSETYCSFIPLKIWQDYGISTYVCGTTKQKLCYSVEILRNSLNSQKPKIVFLETNAVFRKFGRAEEIFQQAEKVFPVFRHHDRWKTFNMNYFSRETDYTYVDPNKGYLSHSAVKAANEEEYMVRSKKKEKIPAKNIRYVKDIKAICDQNNAKLVFISAPSTKNWNYMRHNSMKDFAEELGVDYIDLNTLHSEINIDWSKDSMDNGDHLNLSGALKVTRYLGKYLDDQKIFEDKRELPVYSEWNEAVDEFNKSTKNSLKDKK